MQSRELHVHFSFLSTSLFERGVLLNIWIIITAIEGYYSPALKKWELYWICLVLPSFCHSVILSFCHSVTFQMKIFVTLFSGTVRPRTLKHGTRVDSGQMYHLYRNQADPAYSSLYFFIFLSLQFSNIEIFRHHFLRNSEASRKLLRIKVTPYLHQTYSKNWGNLGLVLKMKNIACISILLTKHVKYTYLYLFYTVL